MSVLKRPDHTKELFHADFRRPLKTKSPCLDLIGRSPSTRWQKMENVIR
jgi:hypothetical protein